MSRALKVYVWNLDGRRQACIAASSWQKAVAPFRTTVGMARGYGNVSDNPEYVAVAMSKPGTPFTRGFARGSGWEEYPNAR